MEKRYLLSEDAYVKRIDSITKLKRSLIENYAEKVPATFMKFEIDDLNYWRLGTLTEYESGRKWIRESQSYEKSSNYPKVYQNMKFNETHLIDSKNYLSFLKSYFIETIIDNTSSDENAKYEIELLKLTLDSVKNPNLLNALYTGYLNQEGKTTQSIDEFFNLLKTRINDTNTLAKLEVLQRQRSKTLRGASIANFNFEDQQEKTTELSDFIEYVVVVDVWLHGVYLVLQKNLNLKRLKINLRMILLFL